MRLTQLFSKTSKTKPSGEESANAILLSQAGFIRKELSGVYTFLPLGLRVLGKIENIIREEMDKLGASEVLMPSLHPKENWVLTGRWDSLDILFKVASVHGYEAALGPTHEEIITPAALPIIQSYRDLPLYTYQIQTKFRDEARAKSGLLRGREFRMKDLYSFHTTVEDLEAYYARAAEAYKTVFNRMGLTSIYTEASGGTFSKFSHEFQVETTAGEDTIYVCGGCGLAKNKEIYSEGVTCTDCGKSDYKEISACEVGNIFLLKTKFSDSFNLKYKNEAGEPVSVQMGCYGIGSSRLIGVIAEVFHDEKGLVWPESVSPYDEHLIALPGGEEQAQSYYDANNGKGKSILFDDRSNASAGEKFADAELIGIPKQVIFSKRSLEKGGAEVKDRKSGESQIVKL